MADTKAPVASSTGKASTPAPAAAATTASSTVAASSSLSAPPSASAAVFTPAGSAPEDPLETAWTFYFDKKLSREAQSAAGFSNYAQNLQKVGKFATIQSFWRHYAYIQAPDQIPRDHNLYLFRDDLLPAWETFPQGGCWIIKVRKGNGVINRLWEELCFACVGEWFEESDVVGISLATRTKDDNIAVWNRGPDMNPRIGEKLKDLLNLDESTTVEHKAFKSAIADNSSFRNAKTFTYAPVANV